MASLPLFGESNGLHLFIFQVFSASIQTKVVSGGKRAFCWLLRDAKNQPHLTGDALLTALLNTGIIQKIATKIINDNVTV